MEVSWFFFFFCWFVFFFFFKQKTAYEIYQCDWSSDVCSSDLLFLFKNNLLLIIVTYALTLAVFNILWFKRSLRFVENKKEDKETIPYGWFVTKIQVLSLIVGNLDKVLIGIFIGPAQLAVYAIGTNFAKKFLSFEIGRASCRERV